MKLVVELKPHGGEPNNYVDIVPREGKRVRYEKKL